MGIYATVFLLDRKNDFAENPRSGPSQVFLTLQFLLGHARIEAAMERAKSEGAAEPRESRSLGENRRFFPGTKTVICWSSPGFHR